MKLIDGKEVSAAVKQRVKDEIDSLPASLRAPSLAVIIVGGNPASRVYVNNKKKACALCGIRSVEYALDESTSMEELLDLIDRLNRDDEIDGILCQLPLPRQLDEMKVIEAIDPSKDVDCFSEVNVGKLWLGDYSVMPCTPAGVMDLLDYYGIDPAGKHAIVIGRSNIVGKPMASLLLEKDATVTLAHSKTSNLAALTRSADIIIVAVGRPKFLSADMVSEGAVVIDVGINRLEDGKLCGDVDFEAVKDKCSFISPVPGGVGPMTIATLMKNTLTAFKAHMGIE